MDQLLYFTHLARQQTSSKEKSSKEKQRRISCLLRRNRGEYAAFSEIRALGHVIAANEAAPLCV